MSAARAGGPHDRRSHRGLSTRLPRAVLGRGLREGRPEAMGILVDRRSRVIVQGITGTRGVAPRQVHEGVWDSGRGRRRAPARAARKSTGSPSTTRSRGPSPLTVRSTSAWSSCPGEASFRPSRRLRAQGSGPWSRASNRSRYTTSWRWSSIAAIVACVSSGLAPSASSRRGRRSSAGWAATPTWANEFFRAGSVGVLSRSGGQSGTIPWILSRAGFGVSTVVHTGTEPVLGTCMADLLPLFEADSQTRAIAVFSEIGGSQEEECAELIASGGFTKPFVAYVAGAWAPEGQRFSHASSIVEHGRVRRPARYAP